MSQGTQPNPNNGAMLGGLETLNRDEAATAVDAQEPELPDNWEELLGDEEEEESTEGAGEGADADVDDLLADLEDDTSGVAAGDNLQQQNQVLRAYLGAALQQLRANQGGAPAAGARTGTPAAGGAAPSVEEVADELFNEEYSELPEDTRRFFKKFASAIQSAIVTPLNNEVTTLRNQIGSVTSDKVLGDYDGKMDALFDSAGLTPSEKRMFANSIKMEGAMTYGDNFTFDHGARLFRKAFREYAEENEQVKARYIARKKAKKRDAPPKTERGSGGATRDDVDRTFLESTSKNLDFGSPKWRTRIRKKLQRVAGA